MQLIKTNNTSSTTSTNTGYFDLSKYQTGTSPTADGNVIHISDDDIKICYDKKQENTTEEDEFNGLEDLTPNTLAERVVEILLAKSKCPDCVKCFYATTSEVHSQDDDVKPELTPQVTSMIQQALQTFNDEISPNGLYHNNIKNICIAHMTIACDTHWITCDAHGAYLAPQLLEIITRVLLVDECKRRNQEFQYAEDQSGNANKISQLNSRAK